MRHSIPAYLTVVPGLWLLTPGCSGEPQISELRTAPAASIQQPLGGTFAEGEAIEFAGRVTDAEDDLETLVVDWTSDRDGILNEDAPDRDGRLQFTTAGLSAGDHVITLRVADSDSQVSDDWIELTIEDLADAPTIEIRKPGPDESGLEGQSTEFEVAVGDLQDEVTALHLSFSSDADGEFCTPTADDWGIAGCEAILTAGDHLITFYVTDTDGNTSSAVAYFEVSASVDVDNDLDGFTESQGDCDDLQVLTHPGAEEIADAADNDCDGDIDEGFDTFDDDGDCFCEAGSCSGSVEPECTEILGGDCDDSNIDIYPDAEEWCDDDDNDCDDLIDENDAVDAPIWYRDLDTDFYGNPNSAQAACDVPTGYVSNTLDCNDSAAAIHPGATELTGDGVDQDCDTTDSCYQDSDNDGYGVNTVVSGLTLSCANDANRAANTSDCNDANALVNPTSTETTADGIDQDCDNVDSCYVDSDNDGFGSSAILDGLSLDCNVDPLRSANNTDCNDASASVAPGASETIADGVDQDCDAKDSCYLDDDNDGFGTGQTVVGLTLSCFNDANRATVSTDCDDGSASVRPNATETVADGIDQNCDNVDSCYQDGDNDGHGSTLVVAGLTLDCTVDSLRSSDNLDCNDGAAAVGPGATEVVADGVDQNCDSADSCYQDSDDDGYGTTTVIAGLTLSCANDANRAAVSTDCDDGSSTVRPNATEIVADGLDQDCDEVDSCYQDGDNDGYGTSTVVAGLTLSCANDANRATVSTDCNDGSNSIYPTRTETVADGVDQDCDNVDSCYTDADNDGYGSATVVDGLTLSCTNDSNRATNATDCNDAASTVYPGRAETVGDSIDQDCDSVDSCYLDSDNDGYGVSTVVLGSTLSCTTDAYKAGAAGDCNDASSAIKPTASEVPGDNVDQNCDDVDSCYQDADNDNYGTSTVVTGLTLSCATDANRATVSTDCNDASNVVYPGRAETTADGIDQDCDSVDSCYTDADNDGYGISSVTAGLSLSCANDAYRAAVTGDCLDSNSAIKPNATEIAGDSIDQNCDNAETCFKDADNDGYRPDTTSTVASSNTSCADAYEATTSDPTTDCNDSSSSVRPNATEIVADGIDQNCDSDELCYKDADNDGYRPDSTSTKVSDDLDCTDAYEAVSTDLTTDCGDNSASAKPGQTSYFSASFTNNQGAASWDYNCDGNEAHQYTADYSCSPGLTDCPSSQGWWGTEPDCGDTGDWGYNCYYVPLITCEPNDSYQATQSCR